MKRIMGVIAVVVILAGGFLFFTLRNSDPIEPITAIQPTQPPTALPSSDAVLYKVAFPEELGEISKENYDIVFPSPPPDLADVIKGYQTSNLDAETDAAIAERIRQSKEETGAPPEYLSHKEAADEIDFIFDLLKYGYGAYQYFGGDEVFMAVKQLMLAKLATMDDPVSSDSYLNNLLAPCLNSVITDNHFWIHSRQMGAQSQLFINEEYVIQKTDDSYFTKIDGRIYKILQTEYGMKALRPTLTRDGELAWAFSFMKSGEIQLQGGSISVELEDVETKEKSTRMVYLSPISKEYVTSLSQDFYTTKDVNGITVLENRRLYAKDENDPPIPFTEFAETGKMLKDKPVVILDLRCHRGGGTIAAMEWIRGYAGQAPSFMGFSTTTLNSGTVNEIYPYLTSSSASWPKWQTHNQNTSLHIKNDNLLIVLMDNSIVSVGESFIALLRQLDNVVFIGTNTAGSLVTGDVGSIQLPVSRLWAQFGVSLEIRPDLSQFEGVGFMPDLWVPPGESLERAVRFVERYKVVE